MTKKVRILAIDDDRSLCKLLASILESRGFDVVTFNDPAEALLFLETDHDFDIVFTDLMMQGMDGIKVLREIKAQYPLIPVILLTAYSAPKKVQEAIEYGAIDYLQKPFKIDQIMETVQRGLKIRKDMAVNIPIVQSAKYEFSVDVASKIEYVGGVCSSIYDILQMVTLNTQKNKLMELFLAMDELVTNAIEHGNKFDEKKQVHVYCRIEAGNIHFSVEDEGEGFDFETQLKKAPSDPFRESGRGIFLVNCYVDKLEFSNDGRKVFFEKKFIKGE